MISLTSTFSHPGVVVGTDEVVDLVILGTNGLMVTISAGGVVTAGNVLLGVGGGSVIGIGFMVDSMFDGIGNRMGKTS